MSALHQALTSYSLPSMGGRLDAHTGSLWAAHGLIQLISSYSGPGIRIRRSSDGSESDISFANDGTLEAEAVAFAGEGDAFITKIYDQSGADNYFSQSTTIKQPKIVSAGLYLSKAQFDGTDDCLQSTNFVPNATAISVVMNCNLRTLPSGFGLWLELTPDAGLNPGVAAYYNGSTAKQEVVSGAPLSSNFTYFAGYPMNEVVAYIWDRTQGGATLNCKFLKSGIEQTATGFSAGTNTGNYAPSVWNIGSRENGAAVPSSFDWKAGAIYTIAKSSNEAANISVALVF